MSNSAIIASGRLRSNFDKDYQAVLSYASSQGYNLPSDAQQIIQNQLVIDLKVNGLWSLLDALWIFMNDAGYNFSRINWLKPTENLMSSNTPFTHNPNQNIAFNRGLNFNFVPSTHAVNYQLNDCSWGWYVDNTDVDTNEVQMGAYASSDTSTTGLATSLSTPSSAIFNFNNNIIINKSGSLVGTRTSFSPRGCNLANRFHSVHLLNGKGNYSIDLAFDKEINNTPTALPNHLFKTISGDLMEFKISYIGAHLTLGEKTILKNLLDQYKIDINL